MSNGNASNTTENLGLSQFEATDKVSWLTDYNNDMRVIDEAAANISAETKLVSKRFVEVSNRIYSGANLTAIFQDEIAQYGDVWAWIQARIQTANFDGIHVGDYIPFTAGGNTVKAEVAGIDTYYNYGDIATPHHIDFISRDCWPEAHFWNEVNYNNGTTVSPNPWLASDIYAWLNSLAMCVPNTATANPSLVAVDYTSTGVYDKLPGVLKNVIVQKRTLLPRRYMAGSLLVDDNNWDWADSGKLWLPSEVEVYGTGIWGSKVSTSPGFSEGGYVQYPLFAQNMKRIKGAGNGGARSTWWLSSVKGGTSTAAAYSNGYGHASAGYATGADIRVPLCFRIA